jgi:multiple sugar transport system substrate-binding protein
MLNKSHVLFLLLMLWTPLALNGCGSAGAANDKTVVRFSIWGSYEEWEMWQRLCREFEAKNPTIKVKLEYLPANYEDKIKVLMAADMCPDVMSMQDEPFQMYSLKDKFEDLTPYLQAAGKNWTPDKFLPTSLEVFRFNRTGRQMGLPWDGGGIIVYYNKKLFREAGIPYPDGSWTWAEFLDIARKLTIDKDNDGRIDQFGFQMTQWWGYLEIWIWGAGGKFFDAENTRIGGMTRAAPLRCTLHSPEAIRGMQFYQDLRFKHHVAPQPAEFTQMGEDVPFMTGRIAMKFNGPWGMPFLRQTENLEWDVAPMPIAPTGRATRCSWDGVAMFKNSKMKQEAWKLIEFIVGERGQTIIAESGRGVPARASVARSQAFIREDTPQHEEHFVDAVNYQRIQPITELWNEMDQIMQREQDKFLLGNQDARATAERMEKDVNEIFSIHEGH